MASPTAFLVDVVNCARACSGAGTDQRAFSAADQSSCSRADGRADTDSFRGFTFARLGIVTPAMAMLIRVSGRRKTTDQNHDRKKKRYQTQTQNS